MELKDAIDRAKKYLLDVYSPTPEGIRLEEFQSTPSSWLITLGFDLPLGTTTRRGLGLTYNREYKVLEVDKSSGDVLSMKIRSVDQLGV